MASTFRKNFWRGRGRLVPGNTSIYSTRDLDGGEFALSNLEHGRYDVLLRFGAHEIELSDVEV